MKIHKLVIPTPFYVGPVNVYLVAEEPVTLIDVGPNTDEAWEALQREVKQVGYDVKDIKRIIVSHAHSDHYGLAKRVQDISGARVYLHSWDIPHLTGDPDYSCHRCFLERAGLTPELIGQFETGYGKIREFGCENLDVDELRDEDEILFQHSALRVIHTPGHTPGSICLLRESNRHLIAADTLLKHITPNPMLHPDPNDEDRRFASLSEYMVSTARIRELHPTLIQTGHGEDITDYHEHFHDLVRHTERRQRKLVKLVAETERATAWEIAKKLFPNVRDVHRFLALSEAQANLDFALADGKLRVEKQGAVEIFRPA